MEDQLLPPDLDKTDPAFERALRPKKLDEFSGQTKLKERLSVLIQAASARGEPLNHCLFSGPPGLGKTTLAHIIASEMGAQLIITSGPAIEKAGDLAGLLTQLKPGDVLFIDEIHRLSKSIEEYLYSAMEDYKLDVMIDSGPCARSVQVDIEPFTLVAATTRSGSISAPMRSRFGVSMRLDHYEISELVSVISRSSQLLGVNISPEGAKAIASRSRGTPRISNNLLKWCRDYTQIRHNEAAIDEEIADAALRMIGIDQLGLDEMDLKILNVLIDQFNGGPCGLSTLAIAIGEEPSTLEEVYEPFLITQGMLKRTPRGREATPLAYSHLSKPEKK